MVWRLGIDLGTNSIGWTVLELDSENTPISIKNMGVRIFSDGRDPKTKEPLAVSRRTARGMRKNIFRRKQRRKKLFAYLQSVGLFPIEKSEALEIKKINPYAVRTKALDEKVSPSELGRALFHLGVRRGFKSNRKDNNDEFSVDEENVAIKEKQNIPEKMKQGEKCIHLQNTIQESGFRTLGEFLYNQMSICIEKDNIQEKKIHLPTGVRFISERSVYYPLRQMYEEEFFAIQSKQKEFYSEIDWEKIHELIFFQRPLKPQERGKCQYMHEKERSFKALPSSHFYRILQEVYNLQIYDLRNIPRKLTEHEEKIIIDHLQNSKELTFDKMRKLLKVEGHFNLETELRNKLNGNETAVKLRNPKMFGTLWDEFTLEEQDAIVEILVTALEDANVMQILEKYPLSEEQKKAISHTVFSSGTTSLCKELTQKLVFEMSTKHLRFDLALILLGFEHSNQKIEKYEYLPYYGKVLTGSTMGSDPAQPEVLPEKKYGKIANPTVHVALNQTRTVVNALIKQYGRPAQIAVELSRDLKASREDKQRSIKKQSENIKQNQIFNKAITDLVKIQYPNRTDRLKYKLWLELGSDSLSRRCLYCGKNIGATDIFTSDIEVEHILPFSRTLLNSESNLTIAHRHCNAKKREQTPYEAFGNNPAGYDWNTILSRVASLKNPVKKARFAPDAMNVFNENNAFIERQLTDNAYLSKISLRYLKAICDNTWAVYGGMTKILRDKWEIDSILKRKIGLAEITHFNLKDEMIGMYKKNRYDHRHHALDSLVVALTDRGMVQNIARKNARSQKNRIEVPEIPFCPTEIIEKLRAITVSFKPDHGIQGKLSKETLLGKIKREQILRIEQLTENDVPNIKDARIRNDFEELIAELGSFKKAKKELQDKYENITIYKEFFVNRVPITALKTKPNIIEIVDSKIREKLQEMVNLNPDEKFERILLDFSYRYGIKKVRCSTFVQSPIIIPADKKNPFSVTRYLNPEEYYAAIIWKIPAEKEDKKPKYEAQFVRRDELDKTGGVIEKRPHPGAKKICQLHKDDYIEFAENGIWKKARIAGYSATRNNIDIRPLFATKNIQDWIIATNEMLLEKGWKQQAGQNYVSINVLFGDLCAKKITVSPIGKICRTKK